MCVSVVVRIHVDFRCIGCCIELMGFDYHHNGHFLCSVEQLMNGRVCLLLIVL